MNSVEKLTEVFGESVVAVLLSMVGILSEIENRRSGFQEFRYLTNSEYISGHVPEALISEFGIQELVYAKYANDITKLFLNPPARPPKVNYDVISQAVMKQSLLAGSHVPQAETELRTWDETSLEDLADKFFSKFSDYKKSHGYIDSEFWLSFRFPVSRGVYWKVSIVKDNANRDVIVSNGLIGKTGKIYAIDLGNIFNINFVCKNCNPDQLINLLGLSVKVF